MESKSSNFWLGMGLGSILGAIVYRCCQTSKAKQLKEKMTHAFNVATDQAGDLMDSAENKVKEVGNKAMDADNKVADKVADKTNDAADKADEMKNKMHNFSDPTRR